MSTMSFLLPANEVWDKVICLQVCVCPWGGYLTRYLPPEQTPPEADTPLGPGAPSRSRHPPRTRCTPQTRYTPWDQVHPPGIHPPGTGTPQTMYTPREQTPPPPGADTPSPGSRHPLGPGTPPSRHTPRDQVHPLAQSMLGDTVNARAVRILLECNLV